MSKHTKKLLSIILAMIICLGVGPVIRIDIHSQAEEVASSVESIPTDYSGEYDGFDSNYGIIRRNIEIHFDSVNNGEVSGTAIIYPSDKADAQYGANGSYYFKGTIDTDTNNIEIRGYEWISYPVQYDNFTFITLKGHLDVLNKTISGSSEEGIWEMKAIDYSENAFDSGFEIGEDSNCFRHSSQSGNIYNGFIGLKNYKLDDYYYRQLIKNRSEGEVNQLKRNIDSEWGGSCYGIAATMGLLFENKISLKDLADSSNPYNYYTLGYPVIDGKLTKLGNVINFYQLSQYYFNFDYSVISETYKNNAFNFYNWNENDDSLSVFLKKLVDNASRNRLLLFGYSVKGSGHAILVTGCNYDNASNQFIIKMFDENSVDNNYDGRYSYMTIDKDYTSFRYKDDNGHVLSNDSYLNMSIQDFDTVANYFVTHDTPVINGQSLISVSAGGGFRATNDKGEYLEYDGLNYSGSLPIYNVSASYSGDHDLISFTTDDFESLSFTNIDNTLDIQICDSDDYLSLSGYNLTEAKLTFDEGIELKGNDCSFEAYVSTDNISDSEKGLIKIDAKAKSDVSIRNKDLIVSVDSNDKLEDINTTSIIGNNAYEKTINDTDHLSINALDDVNGFFKDSDNKVKYFENGKIAESITEVKYDQISNNWYNVVKGVVTAGPTIAKNSYGWWYIDEDGKVDFTANGIYKNKFGWWKTTDGKVSFKETGVFKNDYGWWRVKDSKVDFKANGIYKNANGWWKTTDGKVTFKENGVFKNDYGWWKVKNSKVDFGYTGVAKNKYGWWRIEKGKVNFKFTGIAKNEYGTWYIKDGKVDFKKNGKVKYNGKTYRVTDGKAKLA